MNNSEKNSLTRAISTGVLTNSVFFVFVFPKICIFGEFTIKIGVSTKNKTKNRKKKQTLLF